MEACLSIKFAYLDWLTCKKCLLGGHGKARRTVIERVPVCQIDFFGLYYGFQIQTTDTLKECLLFVIFKNES